MKQRLEEFLNRYHEKPVTWGVDDCSAVAHAWLQENGINARLPKYSSRKEAKAVIAKAGASEAR